MQRFSFAAYFAFFVQKYPPQSHQNLTEHLSWNPSLVCIQSDLKRASSPVKRISSNFSEELPPKAFESETILWPREIKSGDYNIDFISVNMWLINNTVILHKLWLWNNKTQGTININKQMIFSILPVIQLASYV